MRQGRQGDSGTSTKSFLGQVVSLTLLAMLLAQSKGKLTTGQVRLLFSELADTAEQVEAILPTTLGGRGRTCMQGRRKRVVRRKGNGRRRGERGRARAEGDPLPPCQAYPAGEIKRSHGADRGRFRHSHSHRRARPTRRSCPTFQECKARGALVVAIASEGDADASPCRPRDLRACHAGRLLGHHRQRPSAAACPVHRAPSRMRRRPAPQPGQVGHGGVGRAMAKSKKAQAAIDDALSIQAPARSGARINLVIDRIEPQSLPATPASMPPACSPKARPPTAPSTPTLPSISPRRSPRRRPPSRRLERGFPKASGSRTSRWRATPRGGPRCYCTDAPPRRRRRWASPTCRFPCRIPKTTRWRASSP